MNFQLMRWARNAMRKKPEHIDIDTWMNGPDGSATESATNPYSGPKLDVAKIRAELGHNDGKGELCGTTACIAGTVIALAPQNQVEDIVGGYRYFSIGAIAQDLLGLDSEQARHLFHLDYWPRDYREAYKNARTPQDRASAVCNRIDAFILKYGGTI